MVQRKKIVHYLLIVCLILNISCSEVLASESSPLQKDHALLSAQKVYREEPPSKAIPLLEKYLKVFPNSVIINKLLAMSYLQIGNQSKGIHYLKQVLNIDPNYASAKMMLGENLIFQRNYHEAIHVLLPLRDKSNEPDGLGFRLGFAYYQLGRYDRALESFEKNHSIDKEINLLNSKYKEMALTMTSGVKPLLTKDFGPALWVNLKK